MNSFIRQSQIIAFPGGFSAGDEPEGSGKFIAAVFRNELLKDAVTDLLKNRDGLIIGICNGFQDVYKRQKYIIPIILPKGWRLGQS